MYFPNFSLRSLDSIQQDHKISIFITSCKLDTIFRNTIFFLLTFTASIFLPSCVLLLPPLHHQIHPSGLEEGVCAP